MRDACLTFELSEPCLGRLIERGVQAGVVIRAKLGCHGQDG